jgi:hypothetical protein
MANKISKRSVTFLNSDSPLTSKRVKVILSNPEDTKSLVEAVRASRHNKSKPFSLTKESNKIIKGFTT